MKKTKKEILFGLSKLIGLTLALFFSVAALSSVITLTGEFLIRLISGASHSSGVKFTDYSVVWGNLSDWYGGVVGAIVGFVSGAIVIWLAIQVNELTRRQNRLEAFGYAVSEADASRGIATARRLIEEVDRPVRELFDEAKKIQILADERSLLEDAKEQAFASNIANAETGSFEDSIRSLREKEKKGGQRCIEKVQELFDLFDEAIALADADRQNAILRRHFGAGSDQKAAEGTSDKRTEKPLTEELLPYLREFISIYEVDIGAPGDTELEIRRYNLAIMAVAEIEKEPESRASFLSCLRFLVATLSVPSQEGFGRMSLTLGLPSVWQYFRLKNYEYLGDAFRNHTAFEEIAHLPYCHFFVDGESWVSIDLVPALLDALFDLVNPATTVSAEVKRILNEVGFESTGKNNSADADCQNLERTLKTKLFAHVTDGLKAEFLTSIVECIKKPEQEKPAPAPGIPVFKVEHGQAMHSDQCEDIALQQCGDADSTILLSGMKARLKRIKKKAEKERAEL